MNLYMLMLTSFDVENWRHFFLFCCVVGSNVELPLVQRLGFLSNFCSVYRISMYLAEKFFATIDETQEPNKALNFSLKWFSKTICQFEVFFLSLHFSFHSFVQHRLANGKLPLIYYIQFINKQGDSQIQRIEKQFKPIIISIRLQCYMVLAHTARKPFEYLNEIYIYFCKR